MTGTSVTSRIRLERLPAVELRHRHVEDDEIRPRLEHLPERGLAVGGVDDLVAGAREQHAEEAPDVGVVVDDEHPEALHTLFIPERPGHSSRARRP